MFVWLSNTSWGDSKVTKHFRITLFFFQCYGDHRDLHTACRRQRQMFIRDRSNTVCYDAQKRFWDISQPLSPTHRLDLDASWIFETTLCTPSPTGWGGLSGLGWPESFPNQESGAWSA